MGRTGIRSSPHVKKPQTVINMHIGSSSQMAITAPDAPLEAGMALTAENSVHAFVDWLTLRCLRAAPEA